MPGLITHYICGDVCLGRLENKHIQDIIAANRQLYNVGTQGPDVFFYYLPSLYKKSIYQLGSTLHKNNISGFFNSMVTSIDSLENKKEKESAAAYLAGYLTHYALDANTHPYIYYKSGFKTENDSTRKLKYSVNHRNFETNIDILMLKLISSEKPSDKKLWQLLHVSYKDAEVTAKILSSTLASAYNVQMSPKAVYRTIYSMFTANRLLQSKNGKRKQFMEFVENFTIKDNVITSLIHNQDSPADVDYLNLKKSPWCFPWDDSSKHEMSFTDMFEASVTEALKLINSEYAFLKGDIDKSEFLGIVGNKSLSTGRDWDQPLEFKFSDVVFS